MIQRLSHVNIRVTPAALEACRAFYCDVLGLKVGFRPAFASVGYWLYAGNLPLVHLVAGDPPQSSSTPGSPAVQHVAFDGSDFASTISALRTNGIVYSLSGVPGLAVTQVNFKDPAGVGIELSFNFRLDTTSR
jgi:catechol 2,3-dioxygenase-like lactoylglutathione lyase family enzyme